MSHNYYSEINLHITWDCKESMPLLTTDVVRLVHRYLKQKLIHVPGVFVHEVGGTETHIHLAVTLAPTILVSELIGRLKGGSSHEVNQLLGAGQAAPVAKGLWRGEFRNKGLHWVRAYIRDQRRHHARGTIQPRLERVAVPDGEPALKDGPGPHRGQAP